MLCLLDIDWRLHWYYIDYPVLLLYLLCICSSPIPVFVLCSYSSHHLVSVFWLDTLFCDVFYTYRENIYHLLISYLLKHHCYFGSDVIGSIYKVYLFYRGNNLLDLLKCFITCVDY